MKAKILTIVLTVLMGINIVYSQNQQIDSLSLTDWQTYTSTIIEDTMDLNSDIYHELHLTGNIDSMILEFTAIPVEDTATFYIALYELDFMTQIDTDFIMGINDTTIIQYKFNIPINSLSNFMVYIQELNMPELKITNTKLIVFKNTTSIIENIKYSKNKQLIGIYDLLGQQVQKTEKNVVYIYQYSDGTTEKKLQIK